MHYFLHYGIHENAVTITQPKNALILQLVGGSPAQTRQRGLCTPPSTTFWTHPPLHINS